MVDFVVGTDLIEGMATGGLIPRLVLHIDGEAVGELATVVGQKGMNAVREVGQEPIEESRGGVAIALWMNLQIDVPGGAIDGDEGITLAPLQRRQVLEIDVNEADGRLLKDTDCGLVGLRSSAQPMALKTTMNGAAGQFGIDAAAHRFGDVVERQVQLGPKFADQRLLDRRKTDRQCLWNMRPIGHRRQALTGYYRAEHLFALEQALALYDAYQQKASACDARIEAVLRQLSFRRGREVGPLPSPRRNMRRQPNGPE